MQIKKFMPVALLALLSLAGCGDDPQRAVVDAMASGNDDDARSIAAEPPGTEYRQVEWTELMSKEDLDALLNPPEYILNIEDGSAEDQIGSELQSTPTSTSEDRYQQALVSTAVMEEMDGQAIKIPGFIVPLEFSDDQTTTSFFLVPYFGACLHMPPPPPNQIIFVEYAKGLKLESLSEPFWISGVLNNSLVENEMATAAWSMTMYHFDKYLP